MKVDLKALIGKLNPVCLKAVEGGAELCVRQTNYDVEVEHVFRALMDLPECDIHVILRHFDIETETVSAELTRSIDALKRGNARTPTFSPHVPRLLERAWAISSLHLGEERVRSGALLLAALDDLALRGTLKETIPSLAAISAEKLESEIRELLAYSAEAGAKAPQGRTGGPSLAATGGPAPPSGAGDGALAQYTVDLTALAREGKIDPIRGRDLEIRRVVDILMRRRQNNPILTGAPGVGKTAIVEGFATLVASGQVPPALENAQVLALDLGLLQAGAGVKGEFEHRLKGVIAEVKASPVPVILFVDEAHTIIGAGGPEGQGDAANLLKPALSRGELRTIAATTWSEYKRYIEKDPALARRFQVVKVEEPDEATAIEMLRATVEQLEAHHGVRVLEEAVRDAVELSHRHISGRQLPDKAVSLLDTACARVAIGQASPPVQVADAVRRVDRTLLELKILEREQRTGAEHRERVERLERSLARARARQTEIEARWQAEVELVAEIREIRRALEAGVPGEGVPAEAIAVGAGALAPDASVVGAGGEALDPTADGTGPDQETTGRGRLAVLEARLAELQGEDPLVALHVDSGVVAAVISDWTGIPAGKMVKNEIRTVMSLRARMESRIIGQPDALETICRRIGTSSARLEDPQKPTGVFLLVGPSGVGKTETAVTLAELLYGGERNLITVNMSEYQEPHTVSSLKGAPPGYVGYGRGGVLTEAVRQRPYSVVLLDEIEKAHPDVVEVFYQVFDKGVMEDGEGQSIDFKHTIILLTSNVASDVIARAAAEMGRPDADTLTELVRPHLLRRFPASFLGRLVTVPYAPLGDAEIREIVELKLARIQRRFWERHKAELTYDESVVELIAARCTEVDSGARNIDHIISGSMLPELSRHVLKHMAEGTALASVHVLVGEGGAFDYSVATAAPAIA